MAPIWSFVMKNKLVIDSLDHDLLYHDSLCNFDVSHLVERLR